MRGVRGIVVPIVALAFVSGVLFVLLRYIGVGVFPSILLALMPSVIVLLLSLLFLIVGSRNLLRLVSFRRRKRKPFRDNDESFVKPTFQKSIHVPPEIARLQDKEERRKAIVEYEKNRLAKEREKEFEAMQAILAQAQKKEESQVKRVQRKEAVAGVSDEDIATAEIGDLLALLEQQRSLVGMLIQRSENHLQKVDSYMMKNMPKNTTGCVRSVVEVRRILEALKRREKEIDSIIRDPHRYHKERMKELLKRELEISPDSLSTVVGDGNISALKPSEWEDALSELFRRISRRRSVFQGIKIIFSKDKEVEAIEELG